jgi:hypothetical protein
MKLKRVVIHHRSLITAQQQQQQKFRFVTLTGFPILSTLLDCRMPSKVECKSPKDAATAAELKENPKHNEFQYTLPNFRPAKYNKKYPSRTFANVPTLECSLCLSLSLSVYSLTRESNTPIHQEHRLTDRLTDVPTMESCSSFLPDKKSTNIKTPMKNRVN